MKMEIVNIERNERQVLSSILASFFDLVVEATGMSIFGTVDQTATHDLGSGLIDHIQKMTIAAIAMADMKVCAQRS
jgi:hypothetical protein